MSIDRLGEAVEAWDRATSKLGASTANEAIEVVRAARVVLDTRRQWWCKPNAQLWPNQSCPGEKMEHHKWCTWVRAIEET